MSSNKILESFLADSELITLTDRYNNHKKIANEDAGVNIFELISDLYHRENLHSDIIKFFLDPAEKHKEDRKYLDIFLDFLQANEVPIEKSDFKTCEVTREKGRMDILIKGERTAVIVENKINNAGDTYRQLPNYVDKLKNNGIDIIAIVYLSLDGSKWPDTAPWSPKEKELILKKLRTISAFNPVNKQADLYHGWIEKCISATQPGDTKFILEQYAKLLKKLRGNFMDNDILKEFYELFTKGNNYENALVIRKALNDLQIHLALRITEHFKNKCAPFTSCVVCDANQAVFKQWGFNKKSNYSIQIIFDIDYQQYTIRFFDHNNEYNTSKRLDDLLSAHKLKTGDDGYYNDFTRLPTESLPEFEKRLFIFLDGLLKALNKIPTAP